MTDSLKSIFVTVQMSLNITSKHWLLLPEIPVEFCRDSGSFQTGKFFPYLIFKNFRKLFNKSSTQTEQ